MTLVVARSSGGRIAIVSDTMLTEHDFALPPQDGVIKTCMLPGGLCVSFANSPELAARDLMSFALRYPRGTSFNEAIGFFERSSADTGNDYILAFSRSPRLLKIVNGKRTPSVADTQWIGDAAAYDRFREYEQRHRKRGESGRAMNAVLFADELDGSPASDLYSVMRNVISDREIGSTGGFAFVVSSRGEHFRPSVYSDMLYNWPDGEGDDYVLSYEDRIDFKASGENEAYAIAQISTAYLGLNAVAFYLLKGRRLFVFFGSGVGVADRCLVLRDIAPADILAELRVVFRANLNWLMLITSSPMSGTPPPRLPPDDKIERPGIAFPFFCHVNTFPPRRNRIIES